MKVLHTARHAEGSLLELELELKLKLKLELELELEDRALAMAVVRDAVVSLRV